MQYNSNDALLTFDYGAMLIAGILRMQEALAEEERSASYASFWCVDVPIETQNLLLFVGDMDDGFDENEGLLFGAAEWDSMTSVRGTRFASAIHKSLVTKNIDP